MFGVLKFAVSRRSHVVKGLLTREASRVPGWGADRVRVAVEAW